MSYIAVVCQFKAYVHLLAGACILRKVVYEPICLLIVGAPGEFLYSSYRCAFGPEPPTTSSSCGLWQRSVCCAVPVLLVVFWTPVVFRGPTGSDFVVVVPRRIQHLRQGIGLLYEPFAPNFPVDVGKAPSMAKIGGVHLSVTCCPVVVSVLTGLTPQSTAVPVFGLRIRWAGLGVSLERRVCIFFRSPRSSRFVPKPWHCSFVLVLVATAP